MPLALGLQAFGGSKVDFVVAGYEYMVVMTQQRDLWVWG